MHNDAYTVYISLTFIYQIINSKKIKSLTTVSAMFFLLVTQACNASIQKLSAATLIISIFYLTKKRRFRVFSDWILQGNTFYWLIGAGILTILLSSRLDILTFPLSFILLIPSINSDKPFRINSQSKKLLAFFGINFLFMFCEFFVGYSTNSLGLISDSFHMFCDNLSLFFSVIASVAAQWPPTNRFSYGFQRIEVICTFSNTILLFFIAFSLCKESISRLISTPKIGSEHLVLVSTLGLIVNLLGLFFLRDTEKSDGEKKNVFIRSIFMHVLVDALGSCCVIISSILVATAEIYIFDPICSLFISVSIIITTTGLCKRAVRSLLQGVEYSSYRIRQQLLMFGNLRNFRVWTVNGKYQVATLELDPYPEETGQDPFSKIVFCLNKFGIHAVSSEITML